MGTREFRLCRNCKTRFRTKLKFRGCCSKKCQTSRQQFLVKSKTIRKERLLRFSEEIKAKNFKSDVWLRTNWESMGFFCSDELCLDQFNKPVYGFIPDLVNLWFRYVIECDGSIHDLESVKERDEKKDSVFEKKGFHVFRVRHGDVDRLLEIGAMVKQIRNKKGMPPIPEKKKAKPDASCNSPILSKG